MGGMTAWDDAGFPLEEVGQLTVREVKDAGAALPIVDVRAPTEWKEGHRRCSIEGIDMGKHAPLR